MRVDDTVRDTSAVETIREAMPTVQAIYRFGSTATGAANADSDIDLAMLAPRALDPLFRFELQERLASALHRSVDLVDLRAASPVMAMQVLATGRLLHDATPEARGAFEDRVFGGYARLNEERRGILDRVATEGTVYGR